MGLLLSKPKKNITEFVTVKKNRTPKKSPRTKITNSTVKLTTPKNSKTMNKFLHGGQTPQKKLKL